MTFNFNYVMFIWSFTRQIIDFTTTITDYFYETTEYFFIWIHANLFLKTFKLISIWGSPHPEIMCSPVEVFVQWIRGWDFDNLIRP